MMTMAGSTTIPGGPGMQAPPGNNMNIVQRRMRPEDAAMHITVSDPVQHSEGINKYTSYRVDVRPPQTVMNDDGTPPTQDVILNMNTTYSAVLRRYSDFLWLYERLHVERAGAVIPPVPEKQPVGRFSPSFIEDRRMNLERFLRRVAVHPELADAQCLDTFLRADDVTFAAAKSSKGDTANTMNNPPGTTPYSQPYQQQSMYGGASTLISSAAAPIKKEGFKRWFAEAKTSISGDLVKSPDDDLFDEINRYIYGLDNQMKNVSQQASGLVRKGKEIANGLFEFGLAFNLLGQSEADALGDALGKMGETADKLSVLSAEHAEKEMSQFEEPIQDYIKMIHAVKIALQRRHEKRLTYSTCLSEVDTKNTNLAKLRMNVMPGAGQENKVYAAEMSLRRAQEAAEIARDDFATVSQRVLREVDRFKREKAEDMRRTVLDYINLQVEYNKRMEEVWASLIPRLECVQLDHASNNNNINTNATNPEVQPQQQQQSGPVPVSPENSANMMHTSSMSLPQQPPQYQQQYQQQQQQPGMYSQQQIPIVPPGGGSGINVQYRNNPPAM